LGDVLDIGTPSDSTVTVSKMAANSVDSAQYVDGSIDLVHMSADSVDSNQYVDGSIDRVHLAADIIDGTKIADDVINSEHYAAASIDNEHLADDAVGVAELSATGTASSSTFLRGDNAWAAAGGGSAVLIGTASTSSDVASLTITGISSTYDTYMIAVSDMVPSSDSRVLKVRFGDSSGVDSGASDYSYYHSHQPAGYTTHSASSDETADAIWINEGYGIGNAAGEGISSTLWLGDPSDSTTRTSLHGTYQSQTSSSGAMTGGVVFGHRNSVITHDRIQVLFNTGSIATGRVTVWGFAHA